MIGEISDLAIRETVNGAWFIFNLLLVFYFVAYLFENLAEARRIHYSYAPSRRPGIFLVFYNMAGTRAAAALTMIFLGDGIRAGWIWWLLKRIGDRHSIDRGC